MFLSYILVEMNLLDNETSPYLLQHKDNPVDWMPWGPEALARAKAENKPILLSVGYSACHWCHVMAHESFEDEATAALMNQHFINIKVDREERPDIDALYQNALALMGKQGGWPLTMFLTPAGEPFWGGTYFPPQPKYGMPSFREILHGLSEAWGADKDKIEHNIKSLTSALEKLNAARPGGLFPREMVNKVSQYFLGLIDPAHGGIGRASGDGDRPSPKFPNLPIINFLWSSSIRTGMDAYKAAVIQSLTQMCQGGIYDHLGGGFSRYTVDEEWLVPHFEKMLYDNAQFIALLTEVYKETQNPLFRARIEETAEWAIRELSVTHSDCIAFATALDADSEGEEGKYYVWSAGEIEKALGADAEAFMKAYDVTRFGNWENKNILNRLRKPEIGTPAEEEQLASWRRILKSARDQRVRPGLDDKVLTDMNGLMIAALAKAGHALNRADWSKAATSAYAFIKTHLSQKEGGLFHSWRGVSKHLGVLDDYANMASAALALYDVTQNSLYIRDAETWTHHLNAHFHDEDGGYFLSAREADVLIRTRSAHDGAVPAGNGTMVGVLAQLHLLTGNAAYADRAEQTAKAFFGEVAQHFFPFATLLNNTDMLLHPVSILIVPGKKIDAFDDIWRHLSWPSAVKMTVTEGSFVPITHPAFGKTAISGETTAYVCLNQHCFPPVTSPEELHVLLKKERRNGQHDAANDG
jgi:uncharacterized protein YyaL (SSP411 family)